ncbi:LysR family transcriptional regulator [Telmatospirillum sp.]|uniref:LysR family transcriptional regulator n=1 Tax=Telmatospirillum sp. TaxID=2079197 RepID=UPI00283DEB11|nr:LysR family transcriptional regulator [Telmatospirillum sp.]MDR3436095.1 LysR family transcriptional regulator [Telmatospirillum sp.]
MQEPEFAKLAAFVAIVENGSFVKAATALGVSVSTLSQTLRTLEDRLGVRLLNRTTRSLSVTEAGDRLFGQVKPALDQIRAATGAIDSFRDRPAGTLRLSVSSIPAQMVVAPILGAFLKTYPEITLDIVVDPAPHDLAAGHFDAGIRHGWSVGPDMIALPVTRNSRSIAIASPGYLALHPRPLVPHDLHHHRCICKRLGDGPLFRWSFEKNGETLEVAVSGPLILNNADLVIAAALQGVGIGYMYEDYLAAWIEAGQLVPLLEDWSPRQSRYYLYYTSRRQLPPPLKAFIDFVKASATERTRRLSRNPA